MSKNVVLSFDDGRLDTYTNALPIMKKYGFNFTLNVTSDFVLNPQNHTGFRSAASKPMTVEMILDTAKQGNEIALHGHNHKNTVADIRENLKSFKGWGIDTEGIGFASPCSYITKENVGEIVQLRDSGEISYIRSGIQTRRQGKIYAGLQLLQEKTHSKRLFYYLNRSLIIKDAKREYIVLGVGITCNTTVKQIKYLLSRLKDGDSIILMFHSILNKTHAGYKADRWYWDSDRFEELCRFLKSEDYRVIKNIDLFGGEK